MSDGQSATVYTRTRAYFVAQDDFRFVLSRRRWYSDLRLFGGHQTLALGDPELDERFSLRTRHTARARSLFHDRELHERLRRQPSLRLEARGMSWWRRRKRGSRVRVVTARTTGVLTDEERLVDFIGLIGHLLEQLAGIGCAVREPVVEGKYHGELRRRL